MNPDKTGTRLIQLILVITFIVLAGWFFHNEHMKRVFPSLVQMNPLTAILFIFSSFSFLAMINGQNRISISLALLTCAIAGIRLVGFYPPLDTNIDVLLFASDLQGNRMAPNTTFNLVLDGMALLLTATRRQGRFITIAQFFALTTFGIALLAMIGYLYASLSLYQLKTYIPMALNAAFCFLLLSAAILLHSANYGVMAVIFNKHDGGSLARRLLPVAVLIPITLGWLRIVGQHIGLFDPEFGAALMIIFIICVFALVVWLQARSLNRSDEERRRAEQELIRARKEAEDARKIQEQFLANMSHEIRTPMNGVIGMLNLLTGTNLDITQKEYIAIIRESAGNLLVIINDILDFNKIKAGMVVFEKIDFLVGEVIQNVINIIRYKANEKGIRLEYHIQPEIHYTYIGDPVRLNQVLLNLVGNAIKFTEKGSVTLSVILVSDTTDASMLRFEIKDTGIGIPADKLESIFASFSQASASTTRKYGGTGLGLTITKQFVELQGGSITVSSEEDKGTTFSVEFSYPKGKADVQKLLDKDSLGDENNALAGVRILLVEDNKINQKVAVYTIRRWGAVIELAENGNEAIRMLNKNTYNIVLMDLQMPEMDGFETTTFIRNHLKSPVNSIPIIAMTASAITSERAHCLSVGMNDYISKPFVAKELQEKILQAARF